ncbi:MAG: ABC transporter permease [Dehalococcoidia bacterium]
MLRPIFVAILELRRFLSDHGDLAFSIALPIVLFALMYGAFGGDQRFTGTAHVVDMDGGPVADDLLQRLESVEGLSVSLYTEEEANEALDRSRIFSTVIIPQGFSEGLAAGQQVTVTFRQRGSGGDEGQIVASIVQGIAQGLAGEHQVRYSVHAAMAGSTLSEAEIDAVIGERLAAARSEPPITVTARELGQSFDYLDLLMPGILTMFLLFSVTLAAQSIVMERQNGTLERLLTTRLGVNQLFMGKFLGGFARAMCQALVLLTLAFLILRMGGPSEFLLMLLFAALVAGAVSGVGMLLAAVARSRDQGTWMAVFFTLLMTVFGGTFFQPGGGAMETISRFTINRYANDGFRSILLDGTLANLGIEAGVLAGVLVVSLLAARIAFRVAEGGR